MFHKTHKFYFSKIFFYTGKLDCILTVWLKIRFYFWNIRFNEQKAEYSKYKVSAWHRLKSASWLKCWNLHDDEITMICKLHTFKYYTFLIKYTKGNKMKKLHWKLINYSLFRPITKICDWGIHVHFTPDW